jgi:uncharacterized phage protein (TIGR02220 family)
MKSFTIYEEYYDLITLLPSEEEQARVLLAMTKYMFEDQEMVLNDKETKVFVNLKRPLNKSKKQSKRRTKQKPNENQIETTEETELKPQTQPNENTSNDVYVYVNVNVIKDIINYLNKKTNSNFKYQTKSTQTKINARLNEGYTFDDFIAVIDKKYNDWINTEFEKYLCPETLFGTKFEKYLNQKVTKKEVENKPIWIDKTYEEVQATEEEIKKLEERLKGR